MYFLGEVVRITKAKQSSHPSRVVLTDKHSRRPGSPHTDSAPITVG